jgi:hypothetical protein
METKEFATITFGFGSKELDYKILLFIRKILFGPTQKPMKLGKLFMKMTLIHVNR